MVVGVLFGQRGTDLGFHHRTPSSGGVFPNCIFNRTWKTHFLLEKWCARAHTHTHTHTHTHISILCWSLSGAHSSSLLWKSTSSPESCFLCDGGTRGAGSLGPLGARFIWARIFSGEGKCSSELKQEWGGFPPSSSAPSLPCLSLTWPLSRAEGY